jgi:hypothetical protein
VVLPFIDSGVLLSQAELADLSNRPGSPKPVVRQVLSESRASLESDDF